MLAVDSGYSDFRVAVHDRLFLPIQVTLPRLVNVAT